MQSAVFEVKVGLDVLNIQDNQHLKNALINCEDPIKAISDFQEENCILLPTLKPALNLLDLHSVKRLEFNSSIADELKEHLIKRVDELANSLNQPPTPTVTHASAGIKEQHQQEVLRKLEELLEKSFPLICMPRLTQVILLIMKHLPNINPAYLSYLNEDEHLYSMAPIEVKRQIWSINSSVFLKELEPHFDKCVAYFDEVITSLDQLSSSAPANVAFVNGALAVSAANIDALMTKEAAALLVGNTVHGCFMRTHRRHLAHVNEIAKLIGSSGKLYRYAVQQLYALYGRTRDWFYCSLKAQLVARLAELHHNDALSAVVTGGGDADGGVVNVENVFKFATIINQCLKDKKLDTKKAKELEAILESKKFEKIIGEVSFILADPFVIDMLARNTISLLNRCVQNELLPRNCTELIFVLRLLSMSLMSWEIMMNSHQCTKEPNMDADLITEYIPNLAYFIADLYEKVYDDSLTALSNPSPSPSSTGVSAVLLVTSPSMLSSSATLPSAITTPPGPHAATAATATSKKSPPIVLKISTRKIEIVALIKAQIGEHDLCALLLLYLALACVELNDWANLKGLLQALHFPSSANTSASTTVQHAKWFFYQFFNMLCDKSIVDLFRHDWFVTLIFDEFLLTVIQRYDPPQTPVVATSAANSNYNFLYDQIYKLMDKIYPVHLSTLSFARMIDLVKPKKHHSSTLHIAYLKLKDKMGSSSSNTEHSSTEHH